ncbi:transposase, partial [Streptomyces sp. NPDC048551]|uniref:transposase n=1 Tax=Streptomyces sp. NPDC048551 TaxID=3155758 RepID=UPI00343BCD1E
AVWCGDDWACAADGAGRLVGVVRTRGAVGAGCYDYDHLRNWLRRRQIVPRIARRGIEASDRLGRHRWVVERTMSWLNGCRRLHRRYERKPEHFLAFVGIASTLICYRRIIK